ncbi:MAG: nuclear transport factor 2 family protein [Planctomycetes bacterium]|nr:nuclear transport factor 2 family protein [Planctomycetota bacterium]
MHWLEKALFEDPFYIYVTLALAAVVMAAAWHSGRRARWLIGIGLLAAAAGGVFVTERLVLTDREQVLRAYDRIADDVARHDVAAAAEYLDRRYRGWGGLRAAATRAAAAVLELYNVRRIRYIGPRNVEIRGKTADSTVTTLVLFGGGENTRPDRTLLRWNVEWIKRDDGWKIHRAELMR